jgi:nitrate reductase cytochrome c-type subunit
MRTIGLLALVLFILAPPALAEKAKSVEELAAMFDSSRCKGCHGEIYAQWEKSHHARSLMGIQGGLMLTPLATKGATAFSPETPEQATIKTFPCFKCHLPQAVTHADDAFAVDLAKALLSGDKEKVGKLRITCTVCHNEKAIIHRLELGNPEEAVLYSTRDLPSHPDKVFKQVKKSEIFDHAIMCGQCHGLGPNLEFENPVQCATLYGSYQHNYLSKGGTQRCQECHMPKVDGKADHLLAPNFDDIAGTSELLRKAIYLDVQTLGYEWLRKSKDLRPMVVVNTKIWTMAGHRIPDG